MLNDKKIESLLNFVKNRQKRIDDKKKRAEEEAKRQREKTNEFIKKYWMFLLGAFIALILIVSFGIWSERNDQNDATKIAINSSSSEFKGKNYENVVTQLQKAGFTNIKTEALDDLVTGLLKKDGEVEGVKIDDKTNFGSDTKFSKEAEIIITYHTFPKDEKKTESTATSSTEQEVPQQNKPDEAAKAALEVTFPVENAKRSAVVAITNSYAADVFKADGNTYDVSKFHSYADTSGKVGSYFFNVTSWGTWNVKDEKAWHVDSLILKNISGTVVNGSLDVNFDGTNYVLSNITGTYGRPGATAENSMTGLQPLIVSEIESRRNASIFLKVPAELIKNDRSQTEVNALDHSGDLDKYVARTAFENHGKSEYPYGFKCHWLVDLWGEQQSTDGSWFFKVGVEITNQYGASRKAIAEGIISGTTDNPIIKQFLVY